MSRHLNYEHIEKLKDESNQPQCSHICVTYKTKNCLLDIQEAVS